MSNNFLREESFIRLTIVFLHVLQDVLDEYVNIGNIHRVRMINENGHAKASHVCSYQIISRVQLFVSSNAFKSSPFVVVV
jgi:hypothetical protein